MLIDKIFAEVKTLWSFEIEPDINTISKTLKIYSSHKQTPLICDWLFNKKNYHFAGLIVEEDSLLELCYLFVGEGDMGYVKVITTSALNVQDFNSVSLLVHSVDWSEREAEDLYGVHFKNHPRLGDFILHDDVWQEGINPMRKDFDKEKTLSNRKPKQHWRPRKIVEEEGSFIMPIGPVFSAEAESVHLQLETIGEEIIRAFPRLFFKYRGIEKIAEKKSIEDVLLLSERTAGSTAFSHALAYCLAVEKLSDETVPEKAKILRVFFAEIERIRSHIGTIEAICNSTGLVVAASQVGILEEKMLRLSCVLSKHRYFFGLCVVGGLSYDCDISVYQNVVNEIQNIVKELNKIEEFLVNTSSFLDRLEEVGVITPLQAKIHGLVGPMARGSNYCNDMRKFQPYLKYDELEFSLSCEEEGDGYARLRVLFAETRESLKILQQISVSIPEGKSFIKMNIKTGTAFAGVETPRGAAWHRVKIDENRKIQSYRMLMPSFANWHGFHVAMEKYAFQDLPIILATLGLSVAENDK